MIDSVVMRLHKNKDNIECIKMFKNEIRIIFCEKTIPDSKSEEKKLLADEEEFRENDLPKDDYNEHNNFLAGISDEQKI